MSSIDTSLTGILAAQQASVQSNLATAVASKALEAIEQQGQAANELLEGAVQLSRQFGKGASVDTQA